MTHSDYVIEKVSNMVFISKGDIVFKSWDVDDFTEKKLQNAIKNLKAGDPNAKFTVTM